MKKNTTRVQVDLDRRAFEELQKLQKRFGDATYAEVFRRSIPLLGQIIEARDARDTIIRRRADGTEIEIWVI